MKKLSLFYTATAPPSAEALAISLFITLLAATTALAGGGDLSDEDIRLAGEYQNTRALLREGNADEAKSILTRLASRSFVLGDYASFDLAGIFLKENERKAALDAAIFVSENFSSSPLAPKANELRLRAACGEVSSNECGNALRAVSNERLPSEARAWRLMLEAERLEGLENKKAAYKIYQEVYYSYPNSGLDEKARRATIRLRDEEGAASGKSAYPYATYWQRMKRVKSLIKAFRYSDAAVELERILNIGYSEERKEKALFELGKARERMRDRSGAKRTFDEFIRRYPKSPLADEASYEIAIIDWNMDRDAECASRLEGLIASSADASLKTKCKLVLGRIAEAAGNLDKAKEHYEKALSLKPDARTAYKLRWRLGWAAYQEGNFERAAELFDRFSKQYKNGQDRGKFLYWAARSHAKAGALDKAESRVNLLKKTFPHTYYGALVTDSARHRPRGAINGFAAATLAVNEVTKPKSVRLGEKALYHLKRYKALMAADMGKEAVFELAALSKHIPKKPEAAMWLGSLYRSAGAPSKSIRLQANAFGYRKQNDGFEDDFWRLYYPADYWDSVFAESENNGLDPFLALSIIRQESLFDPEALSPANARGLMQLIPATGERVYRKINMAERTGKPFYSELLFKPGINIPLGVSHFAELMEKYEGNLTLALAAYNAGARAADVWRERYGHLPDDELVEMIPYSETRGYVKKVKRNLALYHLIYGAAGQAEKCGAC